MKRKCFDQGGEAEVKRLGLSSAVRRNIQTGLGVASLFDVQSAFIAHAISLDARGRAGDLILAAPTGSGKTIAYAVPVIERLLGRVVRRTRALVLVPTRDLAVQVGTVFRVLATGTDLHTLVLSGGGVGERDEPAADVVVATPGRLVELVSERALSLEHLCYLVVDESDRLLKSSFNDWVDVIYSSMGADSRKKLCPSPAQNPLRNFGTESPFVRKIIASATQTRSPKHLASLQLFSPTVFICGSADTAESDGEEADAPRYTTPETLAETTLVCKEIEQKPILLASLLGIIPVHFDNLVACWPSNPEARSKIVFAKSVEAAHRLARLLEILVAGKNMTNDTPRTQVVEYTAAVRTEQRQKILAALRSGEESNRIGQQDKLIVVCSDVMARGMDLPDVDAVVSYDVPADIKSYLHRVGRTARGGRKGYTVSLVLADQARHFKRMQRHSLHTQGKVAKREFDSGSVHAWSEAKAWLQTGLVALKNVLEQERLGLLSADRPLAKYSLTHATANKHVNFAHAAALLEDEDGHECEEQDGRALLRLQLLRNISQITTGERPIAVGS